MRNTPSGVSSGGGAPGLTSSRTDATMSFKDQLQTDLTNVFFSTSEFAESVTYCPESGVEYDAKAIIDIGDAMDPNAFGSNPAATAKIELLGLQKDPEPNDIIRFSSSTWRIVRGLACSDGVWTVASVRDERAGGQK